MSLSRYAFCSAPRCVDILKGLRDQRPVREDFASCRWQEGVRPAQALKVGASACLGRTELIIDGSGSCDPEPLSAPSL